MAGWNLERAGERVSALAPGIDRAHLQRLRRGEVPVDRSLDLHGLTRAEAREDLGFEIVDARAAGERCLRVVTGRGRGSDLGPVLRDAVIEWLTTRPLAAHLLAFTTALPRDGGPGALYLLLRRPS